MKEVHDGFDIVGRKPDWEKSTTAKLYQHIITRREEKGKTTKLFRKGRQEQNKCGERRSILEIFENKDGTINWSGLEQIKDGLSD